MNKNRNSLKSNFDRLAEGSGFAVEDVGRASPQGGGKVVAATYFPLYDKKYDA